MLSHIKVTLSRKSRRFLAVGLAVVLVVGGTVGIVSAASSGGSSSAATAPATAGEGGASPRRFLQASGSGGRGSNARSGPAAGGSIGAVNGASASGFTLVTPTGQKVTVKETPSTAYENGAAPASASVVTNGESALVLGTTDSATITASEVVVEPPNYGSNGSSQVVPFTRGESRTSKSVREIPSSYKQGTGTIVGGAAADKATQAALSAYPGGVVDRVVQLSNGEYEVHNIGVNWPHHVFVNKEFKVVGAND